jgi:putative RNA 2'-phosphotransferase
MAFNDRKLVYALRHSPQTFGLQLDGEGWADLQAFLSAMGITREKLDSIIANMDKKRLEIKDGKIRAFYGHSFPSKVQKTESQPPDVLYHGTSPFVAHIIRQEGIKSMDRQYVHLSVNTQTAELVGKRRNANPVIFTIDAKRAFQDGVKFYFGNEDIWLADFIPPQYIV